RDLLIVCTPLAPAPPGSPVLLTPVVAAGPDIHGGWLSSSATRRAGLIVITDLAPTILDLFHAKAPAAMAGSPIVSVPASRRWGAGRQWSLEGPPLQAVSALYDRISGFDAQRDSVQRWFVYLCQILLILGAVAAVIPGWER